MTPSVHPKPSRALGQLRPMSFRPTSLFRGGQLIANRYRLDTLVGEGAASEVWSAWDLRRERSLALKIVSLEARSVDDAWGRFEREARIYQKLQGPGFLPVHDFGFLGTHGFIAMELLLGETLEARLKRRRKLSLAELDAILEGVGQALSKAHGEGIIHRDLKPANIFLPQDESKAAAMLLDFGIAHVDEGSERLTKPGMLLGSAAFMSPEQIKSPRAIDTRSDLWAIGIILFRAVSGERPFVGEKADVLVSILNDPPAAFPNDAGAPNLGPFFQRALQKDPSARFQTIAELITAFRAAVSAERGSSERPTLVEIVVSPSTQQAPTEQEPTELPTEQLPTEQRPTLRAPPRSSRAKHGPPVRATKPSMLALEDPARPTSRRANIAPVAVVPPSVLPRPSAPALEPSRAGHAWDLLAQPADMDSLLTLLGAPPVETSSALAAPASRVSTRVLWLAFLASAACIFAIAVAFSLR